MSPAPRHPACLPRAIAAAVAAAFALVALPFFAGASAGSPLTLPRPVPCAGGPCYVPSPGDRWQWQICCSTARRPTNYVDASLDVAFYDVDGFENDGSPGGTVRRLHRLGRRAICYLDAGTYEDWRPDAWKFRRRAGFIGAPLEQWPGQWWVDIRMTDVLYPIMRARLDMCRRKGFDGVQFDDLEVWREQTQGFRTRVTYADELRYAVWLAKEAHRRGLSAAFENDVEQAPVLVRYYDWAILEECVRYRECEAPGVRAFLEAGKLVGVVEYTDWAGLPPLGRWCARLLPGTSGMLKERQLGAFRGACP